MAHGPLVYIIDRNLETFGLNEVRVKNGLNEARAIKWSE